MQNHARRVAAMVAGSLLVAGSGIVAGAALAGGASAQETSSTSTSTSATDTRPSHGQRITDFMSSVLSDLVGKGTLTQAQADAVSAGIAAKAAADEARMTQFRTKAEALVAAAHGLTVEEFRTARSQRTLEPLSQEKATALQADLKALATDLGLPEDMHLGRGLGGPGPGGMDGGRGGHGGRHGHGPGGWGPAPSTGGGTTTG